MIIDKSGKLFGKVSIIDILAVLLVVFVLCGAYFRFNKSGILATGESAKVEYSVLIKGVRIYTVNAFKKGGGIFDKKTGEKIGEIKNVSASPAKAGSVKVDGSYVNATLPDKYDVTVTIETNGRVGNFGIYDSKNSELNVGSSVNVISKWVSSSGVISDVKILD